MTGFWLVSFIVLWVVVIGLALVVLAMAREIESLHTRLDSLMRFKSGFDESKHTKKQPLIPLEETKPQQR